MGVTANTPHPLFDITPRDSLVKILDITPGLNVTAARNLAA